MSQKNEQTKELVDLRTVLEQCIDLKNEIAVLREKAERANYKMKREPIPSDYITESDNIEQNHPVGYPKEILKMLHDMYAIKNTTERHIDELSKLIENDK